MPPPPGCNTSHQQAQDRGAVITSSSITPAKEEQTGLLESGIHLASVSSINSSLICLKIGAILCLQPVFRIPCCQAQQCMPSIQHTGSLNSSTGHLESPPAERHLPPQSLGDAVRWQQLSTSLVPPLVHWWLPKSLWPPQEMAYLEDGA